MSFSLNVNPDLDTSCCNRVDTTKCYTMIHVFSKYISTTQATSMRMLFCTQKPGFIELSALFAGASSTSNFGKAA